MQKKLTAISIIFLLITAVIPVDMAASAQGQAKILTDEMNVRGGPGLSYPIVGTATRDQTYPIVSEKDDWVEIQFSPTVKGWVASWLVEKNQAEQSVNNNEVTSNATNLRIRSGPSTSHEILGAFPNGQKAKALEKNGDWVKISYENVTGWVSTQFVTEAPSKEAQPQKLKKQADQSAASGSVGVSSLNVRKNPEANSEVVATLNRNTNVSITDEKYGWYEINFNGMSGWVASHYIVKDQSGGQPAKNSSSSENPDNGTSNNTSGEYAIIVYDGTNIRTSPSTSSSIIQRAAKGESFSITSSSNDWYEVTLENGDKGYLASWVVQVSNDPAEEADLPQAPKQSNDTGSIKNKTIVLDPGHGGRDSGTIGYTGSLEKKLTWNTTQLLYRKLQSYGANVYLTRHSDSFVSLQSRVSVSHYRNADAFVSVHYDAHEDRSIHGSTAYYYSETKDKQLASDVQAEIANRSSLDNRGVLFGDFYVIRENQQPSILLELGYLSNPQEEVVISSRSYQEKVTDGIANGLEDYFE
ncbi:SH3 domain-containing protein [Bacillus gobiensis]|uniref:SH3 domain-containing protein n=1 Tax=Bacillus gobiensis TaxID=1441095 RepID=UPI003D2356C5